MARRPTCCQSFIAFLMKFLNYLQTFVGVSILIYSAFMLNHWHNHNSVPPGPPPQPHPVYYSSSLLHPKVETFDNVARLNLAADAVLSDVGLVAFIAIDRRWEKDLPVDSTGELDRLRAFFEENRDVCEWVCISVVIIQVLSLLLAIILRALVNQKTDLDNERAYDSRERPQEPLLHPHLSEASGSIRIDGRGTHSDIWSPRMREKYGLNGGDSRQHLTNQNVAVDRDPRH